MSELIVGSINVGGGTIAGIASQEEAEAGTNSTKLMTPQRTKQAIDELVTITELSQEQVEDSANTVFGVVSGQRLEQQTKAALNATGSAPTFAPRAWANFNGVTTVSIGASGNISSITRNSAGDYTLNFTTALPDGDYAVSFATVGASTTNLTTTAVIRGASSTTVELKSNTQLRFQTGSSATASIADNINISAIIYR
jgi:hypothetical protein